MPELPDALEATLEKFARLVMEESRKRPVLADFRASPTNPSQRRREVLLGLSRLPLVEKMRGAARKAWRNGNREESVQISI